MGFLFIVGCGAFWFACGGFTTLIESCLLWGFPLGLPDAGTTPHSGKGNENFIELEMLVIVGLVVQI